MKKFLTVFFALTVLVLSLAVSASAKTTYKIGDVNLDGDVNSKDRTDLARYLARWEGYGPGLEHNIDLKTADLDRNGTVNSNDRTILSKYLAGWEGFDSYIVDLPSNGDIPIEKDDTTVDWDDNWNLKN